MPPDAPVAYCPEDGGRMVRQAMKMAEVIHGYPPARGVGDSLKKRR